MWMSPVFLHFFPLLFLASFCPFSPSIFVCISCPWSEQLFAPEALWVCVAAAMPEVMPAVLLPDVNNMGGTSTMKTSSSLLTQCCEKMLPVWSFRIGFACPCVCVRQEKERETLINPKTKRVIVCFLRSTLRLEITSCIFSELSLNAALATGSDLTAALQSDWVIGCAGSMKAHPVPNCSASLPVCSAFTSRIRS